MHLVVLFLLASLAGNPLQAASPEIRVGYIFSDGQMPVTVSAYRELSKQHPDLADRVKLTILTESTFDEVFAEDLLSVDVLVYDVMNEQMLARFDNEHAASLLQQINKHGSVIGVGQGLMSEQQYAQLGVMWHAQPRQFWADSGLSNHLSLLKFALEKAGIEGLNVPPSQPTLAGGYYYPAEQGGRVFPTWAEFDSWRSANDKYNDAAPTIAIGFYRANFYANEMEIVDALIKQTEENGANAIAYFGYPGHVATHRYLLDEQGNTRADVVLAFLFRFAQPDSAQLLTELDIPIMNLVTLYGRSEQQWRDSATGLSLFEGTFQIAVPELGGLIAPTVVGSREKFSDPSTGLSMILQKPIHSRVQRAVARALHLAELRTKANAEKKLAVIFYNYPAGASTIGASYLNVVSSITNVLNKLAEEGYDIGGKKLDAEQLLNTLIQRAVNIAGYAPGELKQLIQRNDLIRVPLGQYKQWLNTLDPQFSAKVLSDWGAVTNANLMIDQAQNPSLIIPAVRFGNIVVMPQPIRGWGEDDEKLYHAVDLAPHHQYVAAYQWLKNEIDVDAIVHVGTHGTLEWLDGKDTGLSAADAPEALINDIPHFYIYNVDVVGEGLIARRRSAATLIDHMVPPFVKGGIYAELAELSDHIDSYQTNLTKNPQLSSIYANKIRQLVEEIGIENQILATSEESDWEVSSEVLHTLEEYLAKLKEQNIPYGLHTFGQLPPATQRASTIEAIVSIDRTLLGEKAVELSSEIEQNIILSASQELNNLVRGLRGSYIAGGTGGEPIRNPDAYPTGKNFYGIDPDKIPTKAAWQLGVTLAKQMLKEHVDQHGSYPKKVSFVIWGDETMRHEGILESQIFWLLGARPVWNARDKVVDVEVISKEQLNRPRIDIIIASAAEGMFHNVTQLMDKAVQLVKNVDENDNFVRQHFLAVKKELIALGYNSKQAQLRAGVRIFDEAPGSYNLNVSRIVETSGSWDNDVSIAHDYTKKMGHGYGNGFWGEPMEDVFRLALQGTQMVIHSSSTMLYGGLDNDDFYMYMGGLANAVKNIDGNEPELMVTNTRDPSRPEMSSIHEFLDTEKRSRYFNPVWIEGMQKEGYAGAGEIRAFVEYLWGWDATTPNTVSDSDWNEVFAVYVQDKHHMNMRSFFDQSSPFAFQDMTARMLEVIRKGYWQAEPEVRHALAREYFDSVARHGISCSQNTCGNPRLLKYLLQQALNAGIQEHRIEEFQADIEERIGGQIADKAQAEEEFAQTNEAKIRGRNAMLEDGMAPELTGRYEVDTTPTTTVISVTQNKNSSFTLLIWLGMIGLMGLLVILARNRSTKT